MSQSAAICTDPWYAKRLDNERGKRAYSPRNLAKSRNATSLGASKAMRLKHTGRRNCKVGIRSDQCAAVDFGRADLNNRDLRPLSRLEATSEGSRLGGESMDSRSMTGWSFTGSRVYIGTGQQLIALWEWCLVLFVWPFDERAVAI